MKTIKDFNYSKAVQTINFFAKKENGQIDKLKVIKLIWLADRLHLRKYGRPIVNDIYYAMKYGPVGSNVKDILSFQILSHEDNYQEVVYRDKFLRRADNYLVDSINELDKNVFSDSDIECLEEVYKEFGNFDGFFLAEKLSHAFPEWKKFEKELDDISSRKTMEYDDFFKDPDTVPIKTQIFNQSKETLKSSKDKFHRQIAIAEVW